ncbi:MAG: copper resistance protein CopC, partial [Actinomycetota bacterium]
RTTAGLLAALAALLLAAGMVPAAADPPKEIEKAKPGEDAQPNRAPDEVVITFSDGAPEDTSIKVVDTCDHTISAERTTVTGDQASVNLNKAPRGRYRVRVHYTVAEPPPSTPPPTGTPSPTPTETPPPDEETWRYSFRVQWGPACDGSDDGDGGNGGGDGDKKTRYSWGSTNDPSQHGGTHAASPSNPITATTTHSGNAGSASSPSYSPGYSPFYNSPNDDFTTHSAVPEFDSSFGDSAFDSTTEDTPLSDPTDPTLADPDTEVIAPEEADDEQSFSAAPTDSLEPEAGVLVVALAAALLLGAGGGLFLRKADPAASRK